MTGKRRKTQHQGCPLGNVELKQHMYQTTIEEVESKAEWPIQSARKERKPGIQARNSAKVENSSGLSCFPVGTLGVLEHTSSCTTTTRSRRHSEGFRVGDRKDCPERDHCLDARGSREEYAEGRASGFCAMEMLR